MVSFTEMGNINDEFKTFQEKLEREQSAEKLDRELASHGIVYMVRGIFSNYHIRLHFLHQPVLQPHNYTHVQ